MNYSVIVNHREKGFGCSKKCNYCTWRNNELLPHGLQSTDAIVKFAKKCDRPFITFSGGGDPLYHVAEYGANFMNTCYEVHKQARKLIRIITREVEVLSRIKSCIHYASISLDDNVEKDLRIHRDKLIGMNIECSLVMPPLCTFELIRLLPQYEAIQKRIGYPLVLRENLNSAEDINLKLLCKGLSRNLRVSSRETCLSGRYLLDDQSVVGTDFLFNMKALKERLVNYDDIYVYGGFMKHLFDSKKFMEYGDIDIAITRFDTLYGLLDNYHYSVVMANTDNWPSYYILKSRVGGPDIHVSRFDSVDILTKHIMNAQYQSDRVYLNKQLFGPTGMDASAALTAITNQILVPCEVRDNIRTAAVERHHMNKQILKGFRNV